MCIRDRVETIGCSGMTHSAAMAAEILPGKTILEALNTDLVCDAINTACLLYTSAFFNTASNGGRIQDAATSFGLATAAP